MNSNIAPQSTQDDAVIRLKCPQCSGGLNLRRKHLGINGKCVHCKAPITAVEEAGVVALKHSAEVQAAASSQDNNKVAPETAPLASPASSTEESASQFVPPPMAAPVQEVQAVEEAAESTWGFPKREDEAVATEPAIPAEERVELNSNFNVPNATADSFSSIAASNEGAIQSPDEKEDSIPVSEGSTPPEMPTGFGFSEKPTLDVADETVPVEETPEEITATPPSDLFESKTEASSSPLFSSEASSGEVNSGWGAKVPNQNHASISPFSTGSAEPDPGFAETLFREKAKEDTGQIQPKSPFGNMEDDSAPLPTGALFGASQPAVKKTEPKEEVILDGDGRPLREMTPEEKENFASDLMHFGEYHKRSPWIKRIVKFFVTLAVLGGVGYAAYVFLPEEQVKVAKEKVFNWLEPGSVLMEYIPMDLMPFEVAESEDGEKEIKIKALEGLDNLSTQMDSYLSTAEEQLNSTLPEGAEGYKREAPADMPELPEIPKLPFGLGGSDEEAAPAE